MKRILASLIVLFALFSTSCAQSKKEEKKEETSSVVQMDKQMFLDKVFDYTTGATEWKYQGDKPAVIDFYATWCGPCRNMLRELDKLAAEHPEIRIGKVNIEDAANQKLAADYDISTIPSIYLFCNGEAVRHLTGFFPARVLAEKFGL